MLDPNIGPPSLWDNPSWWESILGVIVVVCTIIGFALKLWVRDPLKSQATQTTTQLNKMEAHLDEMGKQLTSIMITLESLSSSVHSAHHRIDSVEDRIKRIEDIFFHNK